MTHFHVISLLPDMFSALTQYGITGKAHQNRHYQLSTYNPRQYTKDIHHTVDDRPYGGGPGMVMMYQPIKQAIQDCKKNQTSPAPVIYLSPQGKKLTHQKVIEFTQFEHLTLLCGRYEGVDQRVIDHLVDEEISIGDYVLSGGEIPAMALMDSIIRQIPGVLGHPESAIQDSFVNSILDAPHYTRPEKIDGYPVPEILLSGHHKNIAKWRDEQAHKKTSDVRPDLCRKD